MILQLIYQDSNLDFLVKRSIKQKIILYIINNIKK